MNGWLALTRSPSRSLVGTSGCVGMSATSGPSGTGLYSAVIDGPGCEQVVREDSARHHLGQSRTRPWEDDDFIETEVRQFLC